MKRKTSINDTIISINNNSSSIVMKVEKEDMLDTANTIMMRSMIATKLSAPLETATCLKSAAAATTTVDDDDSFASFYSDTAEQQQQQQQQQQLMDNLLDAIVSGEDDDEQIQNFEDLLVYANSNHSDYPDSDEDDDDDDTLSSSCSSFDLNEYSSTTEDDDDEEDNNNQELFMMIPTRTEEVEEASASTDYASHHNSLYLCGDSIFNLGYEDECNNFLDDDDDGVSDQSLTKVNVRFGTVSIREYAVTIGARTALDDEEDEEEDEDNSENHKEDKQFPIQLSWEHSPKDIVFHYREYERLRRGLRCVRRLSIDDRRERIAKVQGISVEELNNH